MIKINMSIIILSLFLAVFVIDNNVYSKTLTTDVNDKLYLIRDIPGFKNCIVNDKSEIIYTSLFDEEITIVYDDILDKPALLKIKRYGEKLITNTISYDDGITDIYKTRSERYCYYDVKGNIVDMKDDNIDINYVYNGYAIDNNFDEQDYTEAKIFDLNYNNYINNNMGLNIIICENNNIFGKKLVLINDNKKYLYYLLNDDLSINKEITSDEYEDLNGNNYEECIFTDKGIKFGIKHNLKYILDDNSEKLSDGYNCELIGMANFTDYSYNPLKYNYDYKDIIFYRVENNQVIYFTLDKELYRKNIIDNYDKYGRVSNHYYKNNEIFERMYNDDETFIVGKNNCYSIINDGLAKIYCLDSPIAVATLSSVVDNRNREDLELKYRNKFYIDDIYVYGQYVICGYYDYTSDGYIKYLNIKNGYGVNILNKESINLATHKCFVMNRENDIFQSVIDINTGDTIKVLYHKYIDMKVYENNSKYIIALQKDYTVDSTVFEIFDLYDKDYNLLFSNVYNIEQSSGLLSFERFEIQNPIANYNDGKLYNKHRTIISFDFKVLFENDINVKNGVDYRLEYLGAHRGINCVGATYLKNGNVMYRELLDDNKKRIIELENITKYRYTNDSDNHLLLVYTSEDTYVYKFIDGKYKLIKKFKGELSQVRTIYLDEYTKSNNHIILNIFKNEKNGLYSMLDNNYNVIGENYKYIEFDSSYYYYWKGFKIHICDFNYNEKAAISYFNSLNDE